MSYIRKWKIDPAWAAYFARAADNESGLLGSRSGIWSFFSAAFEFLNNFNDVSGTH